jgi:N-acetylmuramoyl-L-alanine amidase
MAFKIAYGAGHYMWTAGKRLPAALDKNETREWELNDRVARHFAAAAAEYEGVELLRVDDPTGTKEITLQARCAAANKWGADMCIAIHHNAGIKLGNGGGIEAFAYKEGTKAAEYRDAIYSACIAAGGLRGNRSNPTRTADFYVLRYTHAPAVLVEYGYMDSRTDAPVILTEEYSKLVAYATMAGIALVAGLRKKQPQQAAPAKKTVAEIAREVALGKWGNGEERKAKLAAAGYDYNEVQAAVNELLTGKKPTAAKKSVDDIAREVLAGKWGNGIARKVKLAAAGYDPAEVQQRVNALLKG